MIVEKLIEQHHLIEQNSLEEMNNLIEKQKKTINEEESNMLSKLIEREQTILDLNKEYINSKRSNGQTPLHLGNMPDLDYTFCFKKYNSLYSLFISLFLRKHGNL